MPRGGCMLQNKRTRLHGMSGKEKHNKIRPERARTRMEAGWGLRYRIKTRPLVVWIGRVAETAKHLRRSALEAQKTLRDVQRSI